MMMGEVKIQSRNVIMVFFSSKKMFALQKSLSLIIFKSVEAKKENVFKKKKEEKSFY